jgi:aminoglycoside phosphotransferase
MERLEKEQFFYNNVLPYLPDDMKALLEGHSFDTDTIGCSGSSLFSFDNDLVLKVEQKTTESDGEYQMMNWLLRKLPVPEIVSFHTDGESNYLLMTKLQGKMACDTDIMADGEKMARLLAKGLKRLWQVDLFLRKIFNKI